MDCVHSALFRVVVEMEVSEKGKHDQSVYIGIIAIGFICSRFVCHFQSATDPRRKFNKLAAYRCCCIFASDGSDVCRVFHPEIDPSAKTADDSGHFSYRNMQDSFIGEVGNGTNQFIGSSSCGCKYVCEFDGRSDW